MSLIKANTNRVAIDAKSHKLLKILLNENEKLKDFLKKSASELELLENIKKWALSELEKSPEARAYHKFEKTGRKQFEKLTWKDFATIRILNYIENAGREIPDLNYQGDIIVNNPFKLLWLAYNEGKGGAKADFFEDMIMLFRQFSGKIKYKKPAQKKVKEWMDKHPSGVDKKVIEIRKKNKERIINLFIDKIDKGIIKDPKFSFEPGLSRKQKVALMNEWWDNRLFHLRFAIRKPDMLNEFLDYSLDPDTMQLLNQAHDAGIPTFVNPYYLSLLNVDVPEFAVGADLAIRDYIFYSRQLVEEFGRIVAWEKEDIVQPGKPNAAGWILPTHHNIHRRYPEVAILIPDSMGRACGGLCASCQRMYEFQSGVLNFDLDKLLPKEDWPTRLEKLMNYFETDSQLRDILITGGDALMSSDKTLSKILEAVYTMAVRKKEANKKRADGEKYAEMVRVRLGTRLPVYLPQRITPELIKILADFKDKASKIGIKQFVIQTHFESAMEITPEAKKAVELLLSAGWIITNQQVFTTTASRRGHTAKLRKVLNDIGVMPYYTFTTKGYMENYHNFATNSRAVQEQMEEKINGRIPEEYFDVIRNFPLHAEKLVKNINKLRKEAGLPFLATDRNVLNLPGVGKSLTFRVIGITREGRRILEFDHDATRVHSPIINKMGKVIIIESKTIRQYLDQIENSGDDVKDYISIFGYSIGETEVRMPVYEYPEYDFNIAEKITNLEV